MARKTLNLGILAHVDAGKTTLTERLLYAAGVIDAVGSVDDGTTQTDSLALERQRGITIKAAVVSFAIDDVTVNLIDTPGHPDFIAEVERVLGVLDGAVLVVSAVEGVQAQTRVLMRALRRLRVPTLVFVNKIDRPGAGDDRVLRAISEKLTSAVVPLGSAHGLGTPDAAFTPWDAAGFAASAAPALAEQRRLAARRVPRGRDERLVRRARRADAAGAACIPSSSGRRAPARASTRSRPASPGCCPRARPTATGRRSGHRLQGRARAGRREDRLRADVLRDDSRARPRPGRPRRRGEGHRRRRLRPRWRRAEPGRLRRPDREGLGARATCGSATRSATRTPRFSGSSRRRRSRRSSSPARRRPGRACASPWRNSPSRTRSSTSARTMRARSCPSRCTARCRRRSSRRRSPPTSGSTSASARRRRSTSSGPSAPARPSSCSARREPVPGHARPARRAGSGRDRR